MRLSKRTEYGLRAVVQLARLWPRNFVQARDLSQQEDLPNKFLESILLALRRGEFLESKVGSGGGYRLSRAPKDIVILHPGPMNRGVEIDSDVADGEHSVILPQVTNGVAVRMAVLYLLAGGTAEVAHQHSRSDER